MTEPTPMAAQPALTPSKKTTQEWGEKNEKKKFARGGRKDCLSFASTFHLWSRLTKLGSPPLFTLQGTLKTSSGPKTNKKEQEKDTKSTPPSS